jgi:hypothetical protein
VINHPYPFALLGGDVLRGGRPREAVNFRGLKVETTGLNEVKAWLEFAVGEDIEMVPLPHAPAGAIHFTGTAIAHGSSGQRLRRNF